jgi:ABC-type transporter Mla MlaB component
LKIEMHEGVISLSGVITQNLWPVLAPAVKFQLRQHQAGIVLDCHGVQDFNVVGSETLLEAGRYVHAHSGQAVLAHAPASVTELLRDVPDISKFLAWSVAEGRERLGLPRCSEGANTILVGLLGTPVDSHAIAMACQLLTHSKVAERVLHLAYLVKITHEMPLFSPDGAHETLACESLEAMGTYLREQNISMRIRVERSRHPAQHLLDIATLAEPEQIILALPRDASEEDREFLTHILEHATSEVLVHWVPKEKDGVSKGRNGS